MLTLDPALVTGHSVNLTGLSSFKTYHYKVESVDALPVIRLPRSGLYLHYH